jgi:alpha-galactosidase
MNGVTLSGSALAAIGVTAPILAPANALLIEITKA